MKCVICQGRCKPISYTEVQCMKCGEIQPLVFNHSVKEVMDKLFGKNICRVKLCDWVHIGKGLYQCSRCKNVSWGANRDNH